MALARVTTWVDGQILTALALNGEFDNILTNPLALISPTTGAINFASQAHTNFRLQNVVTTPTPATAGMITFDTVRGQVEVDDGTIIRSVPTINSSNMVAGQLITAASSGNSIWATIAPGSSGTVLTMTSSNSAPSFQAAGAFTLTTGTISTGAMLYYTTAGALNTLPLGTPGFLLTVSSSQPAWVAAASAAAGTAVNGFSSRIVYQDDFNLMTTSLSATAPIFTLYFGYTSGAAGGSGTVNSTTPGGYLDFPSGAGISNIQVSQTASSGALLKVIMPMSFPVLTMRLQSSSTSAGIRRVGMWNDVASSNPTDGLFFRTSAGSTWRGVARIGGAETIVVTTALVSTGIQTFQIVVTTSQGARFYTNNILAGSVTTSAVTSTFLTFGMNSEIAAISQIFLDGWQVVQDAPSSI